MKISNDRNYINRTKMIRQESQPQSSDVKRYTRNFDEITIHSKETFDEAAFAKELSRKILREVSTPADTQKTEELKAQVQSGEYCIMIDEIAKKMLIS